MRITRAISRWLHDGVEYVVGGGLLCAVAGTALTPGGTTGWNSQKWQKYFEQATYQRMKFIPTIDEGDRPFGLLNVKKHARVSGATLGQSDDGTGLTYLSIIATAITVTPVGSVVPVAWSQNEDAQIDGNLDAESSGNVEQALAELTETTALANVSTLTKAISVASVTGPVLRRAFGNLTGNTNGMAEPGGQVQVYGVFSHTQLPALGDIPEFNQAQVRGDSENPYIKGIWTRGGGIMLLFTTVVAMDDNGWHNCLYIPSAFVIAWNARSKIVRDSAELQKRVIAYNNVGSSVKHDLRAIQIITTDNPL